MVSRAISDVNGSVNIHIPINNQSSFCRSRALIVMSERDPAVVCHCQIAVDGEGYVRESFLTAIGAADIQILRTL